MTNRTDSLADRTIGEIVAENYRRAAVFKRHGIDFCCGGDRTLRAACGAHDVVLRDVERELLEVGNAAGPRSEDPRTWDLEVLVRHIVDVHHRYVRQTLPVLERFSEKVAGVHGGSRPELIEIDTLVKELAAEMREHLAREEEVVFPCIEASAGANRQDSSSEASADTPVPSPDGCVELVDALEDDHDRAGSVMERIRELSGAFVPPEGACTTYRALYAELEEFERDLHRHVHLENNVLFPRIAVLENGTNAGGRDRALLRPDRGAMKRS